MRAIIIFSVALCLSGCGTGRVVNPWGQVEYPAPAAAGGAQSIGSYSAGCLRGGVSLPPDGQGFQVVRIVRNRFYGHPALVDYIQKLGAKVYKARLGALLIGDLAQPRGGPTMSTHKSHQIGLDVDIWFTMAPMGKTLTLGERQSFPGESMLTADHASIDRAKWSPSLARVLKLAADFDQVERIFVSPVIKRELCTSTPAKGDRAWLRKLRPWWGHDDHFHVRLKCQGPDCKSQESIPPGDGCDATLDWWFSDEAKAKAAEPEPAPKMPDLPAACQEVLKL